MTNYEAVQVVSWLNAVFHREALEPETFKVWVNEVASLKHFDHALATAKSIGRTTERFPSLHHFREDYLRRCGREVDVVKQIESVTSGPRTLPPEAVELMRKLGIDRVLKDL